MRKTMLKSNDFNKLLNKKVIKEDNNDSGGLWIWTCHNKVYKIVADSEDEAYEKAIAYRMQVAGGSREDNIAWFSRNDQLIDITNATSISSPGIYRDDN